MTDNGTQVDHVAFPHSDVFDVFDDGGVPREITTARDHWLASHPSIFRFSYLSQQLESTQLIS